MTQKTFMTISDEELTQMVTELYPNVCHVEAIYHNHGRQEISCRISFEGDNFLSNISLSLTKTKIDCWDFPISEFDQYKWERILYQHGYSEKNPDLLSFVPEELREALKQEIIQDYQNKLRAFFDENTVSINPKNNQPLYVAEDNTWHDLFKDFAKQYAQNSQEVIISTQITR